MNDLTASILEWAAAEGFELAGIAEAQSPPHWGAYRDWIAQDRHGSMSYLRDHLEAKKSLEALLPGAKSALAVGLFYGPKQDVQTDGPKIARYARSRDYHKVLRTKLQRIGRRLTEAHPDARWRVCVDSAPLMERDFAQLAGLGWFGKNTMLIDSKRGSWFVLGFLLTDIALLPSEPAVGGCGKCQRCIDACPTGAIIFEEDRWQVDARRCISYLTIEHKGAIDPALAAKMGDWTFGCDICQEVCPFNAPRSTQPMRAPMSREPDFQQAREWPDLVQLSQLESEEWDRLTRGSPVRRAGLAGLRRNATINLENRSRSATEAP